MIVSLLRLSLVGLLGALVAQSAVASDLNLVIESGGSSVIQVLPGDTVNYTIRGELSDSVSQGLAMFAFDLHFDGGSLSPVAPGLALGAFVAPMGLNNPAGYGGTPSGGDLLQIGGAQNTIANTFASKPLGLVEVGHGMPGTPSLLAQGVLIAPTQPGVYTLTASNLFANVIDPSATGVPFWKVQPCGEGTLEDLVILVGDCATKLICPGTVNSQGCTANLFWAGEASFSGGSTLTLGGTQILNRAFGAIAWSTQPGTSNPFGNPLCLGGPLNLVWVNVFSPVSGAPYSNCSATFRFTVETSFLQANALVPGTTVYMQAIYRDPLMVGSTVSLTPAVSFVVCP